MSVNTLIIGGGPAGLTAALFSAGPTLVLDRMPAPGRKLLATGGGRCNLTHETDAAGIMSAFGRQARFMAPALHGFPPAAIRAFFREHGVETLAEPDGCVFPVSQKAVDVVHALERAARAQGAAIRCGVRATRLVLEPDPDGAGAPRVVAVETTEGRIPARHVILAAGGQSYPSLGSDGSGFELARQAGLAVTPPVPGLAGLVTRELWPHTLAGIVMERGGLRLDVKGAPKAFLTGALLFTYKGLSGPPALDLSGEIAARLLDLRPPSSALCPPSSALCPPSSALCPPSSALCPPSSALRPPSSALCPPSSVLRPPSSVLRPPSSVLCPPSIPVRVSFDTAREVDDWHALFESWRTRLGGRALHNLLSGELPRALATALCDLTGAREVAAARAKKETLRALAEACADLRLHITGTEGWDRAMVTRGGIALRELDPQTLACRNLRGLACAGEVVDLDGRCGGYNLTWAFASGRLAGLATRCDPS